MGVVSVHQLRVIYRVALLDHVRLVVAETYVELADACVCSQLVFGFAAFRSLEDGDVNENADRSSLSQSTNAAGSERL